MLLIVEEKEGSVAKGRNPRRRFFGVVLTGVTDTLSVSATGPSLQHEAVKFALPTKGIRECSTAGFLAFCQGLCVQNMWSCLYLSVGSRDEGQKK